MPAVGLQSTGRGSGGCSPGRLPGPGSPAQPGEPAVDGHIAAFLAALKRYLQALHLLCMAHRTAMHTSQGIDMTANRRWVFTDGARLSEAGARLAAILAGRAEELARAVQRIADAATHHPED